MYLPFCSLLMKIMKHEGVCPRKDEKIIVCHCPISIASLQKSKIYPQHQRVNLFNMSLTQVMAQLLTLPLDISRLHLLTFLSLKQLALCQDNLALTSTSSLLWLKVYMSVFQDFQMPSTPQITRFKCVLLPLRHN